MAKKNLIIETLATTNGSIGADNRNRIESGGGALGANGVKGIGSFAIGEIARGVAWRHGTKSKSAISWAAGEIGVRGSNNGDKRLEPEEVGKWRSWRRAWAAWPAAGIALISYGIVA